MPGRAHPRPFFDDEQRWLERIITPEPTLKCDRCPKCHPGKQWGGEELCKDQNCTCHKPRRKDRT